MNRIKWICILFLGIMISTCIMAGQIDWSSDELSSQKQAIRTQESIIDSTELALVGFINAYNAYNDAWMVTIGTISAIDQQIGENNVLLGVAMEVRRVLLEQIEDHRVDASAAMEQYSIASKELTEMEPSEPDYDATLERYIYWSNVLSYHQNAINELDAEANQALETINALNSEIVNLLEQSVILLTAAADYLSYMNDLYYNEIAPRQTTINNANNEITRIETEVITSHIESHGENEEPHDHSGP